MNSSAHANIIEILIIIGLILLVLWKSKKAKNIYLRPIPGAELIRYSIARAAEAGKTVCFSTGITSLGKIFCYR
jgi:hypothetical protein